MAEASRPGDGNIIRAGAALPPPRTRFGSCPLLGLADDRATHATFATPRHRCYAKKRPQPIEAGHQGIYCLGTFEGCSIYASYASAVPQAAAAQPLAKPDPPVPSPVAAPPTNPPAGSIQPAPAPAAQQTTSSGAPSAAPERTPIPPAPGFVRRWLWLALLMALGSGILADLLGRARVRPSALSALVIAITLAALLLALALICGASLLRRSRG
ncbi:MAG: hypothetical protein M1118_04365 [Chloroflexi bacterium]|nr:hypothetical protein [Chloroflexota bacterium]